MNVRRPIRLILTLAAWETLRPLLLDRSRFAVGGLRWRARSDGCESEDETLVDSTKIVERLPQGMDHQPLDDFLVVGTCHDGNLSAAELLNRVQPRPSQLVVVLMLDARAPGEWDGCVFRDEELVPLGGFQVAGPGMLSVDRRSAEQSAHVLDSAHEVEFTHQEVAFSRLRGAVGASLYRKLRRAVVTQIGVSRNGTLAAQQFAALGVALLRLGDPQILGEENLDGMPGVPRTAIGGFKTHAVAEMILGQRPDMGVSCCEQSLLSAESACLFAGRSDLIVTCVDDDAARVAATIRARRLLVPHLDIATSVQRVEEEGRRFFGDARLFLPGQGCAACVPRLTPDEREAVLYELNAPVGSLHRGEDQPWYSQRAGSLITLNALTVAAAIQSWLDLLGGSLRTSFWQRLDWIPGQGIQSRAAAVGPSVECPFCGAE